MNPWNKKVVFILLSVLLWTTISAVGILNAAFLMLSGNSHVNGKVKGTNFLAEPCKRNNPDEFSFG